MVRSRVRCTLAVGDGPARRVGPNGVLIGRLPDCDIVADDPGLSSRHALIRLTSDGPEIVPLARGRLELNGKSCDRAVDLRDGDVLVLPGLRLTVRVEANPPDRSAPAAFRLERVRGGSFGIVHSPFVIGGGDSDDLIVKRWPTHALRLHVAQGDVFVEATAAGATRNGESIELETLEPIELGDQLAYRDEAFILRAATAEATTALGTLELLPRRVRIEMLPRGGRVVFSVGDGDHMVYLTDRRLDLLIALLRPPAGFRADDFIPDDLVRAVVWPRNDGVSRHDINVLISRCRRDLIAAGLAGPRLIVRAPGGGGTRIALAPGAEVTVAT